MAPAFGFSPVVYNGPGNENLQVIRRSYMSPDQREYKGWTITIEPEERFCSRYAMTLTSPDGSSKRVPMAGENRERALERGQEMIDAEIAWAGEEHP
jgi:hypothetical protein